MSSINTNASAMNALSTLRGINKQLEETQGRISTGLKVESAKDNASYFQISETMSGDSSMYKAINEGLTLTKNSIATARLGAESFQDLSQQFQERVAFAQGAKGGYQEVEDELNELIKEMETTITQSTFNGDDMVNAANADTIAASTIDGTTGVVTPTATTTSTRNVVTGVSRASGSLEVTTTAVDTVDLASTLADFKAIATGFAANAEAATGETFLSGALKSAEAALSLATDSATALGLAEATIEGQQEFLTAVADNIDSGVGAMIDADMEEEAARLQALQVQQQLATQSLSIANSAPQNILSLFQ
ncbi:flagellin [Alloyangia pacifica]|uniref:flagellin N-terminal helical domain-containing protein n=1 Tax=Alloyangia pacifica TaxID=311180 RepID=UPI001CFE6E88|nr:flagellin [Alloyangia pacifica]